ncbi:hypothetical protein M5E87_02070 [Flavonifractor plautii]|nr:hypothetical protein M5E87_02070 [Flavonifractor plautii]
MNALKNGKVTMTEGKDVSFTVSGLEKETAYDLYYVAQDRAGNYSETVGKITIHTLDPNAPTVTQEFTKYNGTDSTTPLPNTDVRLVFSEGFRTRGRTRTCMSSIRRWRLAPSRSQSWPGCCGTALSSTRTRETARPLRLWITRMTRTTGRSITRMW